MILLATSILKAAFLPKSAKQFYYRIKNITGYYPRNTQIYKLVCKKSTEYSIEFNHNNFERLEFLGDSVLGMVIADFLYQKFPNKDEGFMTEIRSRLVNASTCEYLCQKIGLKALMDQLNNRKNGFNRYAYSDSYEALIGAIYTDRGIDCARKFILRCLERHIDLHDILNTTINFKSKIIEWAQREGKKLSFEVLEESKKGGYTEFIISLKVDGENTAIATAGSKKRAEQSAAKKACLILGIDT